MPQVDLVLLSAVLAANLLGWIALVRLGPRMGRALRRVLRSRGEAERLNRLRRRMVNAISYGANLDVLIRMGTEVGLTDSEAHRLAQSAYNEIDATVADDWRSGGPAPQTPGRDVGEEVGVNEVVRVTRHARTLRRSSAAAARRISGLPAERRGEEDTSLGDPANCMRIALYDGPPEGGPGAYPCDVYVDLSATPEVVYHSDVTQGGIPMWVTAQLGPDLMLHHRDTAVYLGFIHAPAGFLTRLATLGTDGGGEVRLDDMAPDLRRWVCDLSQVERDLIMSSLRVRLTGPQKGLDPHRLPLSKAPRRVVDLG